MSDDPNQATPPQPEELQAQTGATETPADADVPKAVGATSASGDAAKDGDKSPLRPRSATYRPSHKATFVGIGVVVGILAINAGAITYFINTQDSANQAVNREDVTLSAETLGGLGVSRNPVGTKGTQLTIGPDTQFNGEVVVGGDVRVQGGLKLSKSFTAPEGSFTTLKAGKASLSSLNVNGDATVNNLISRKDLTIAGSSRLQGPVTITALTSITNNLNVSGNLAIGGVLSAKNFQANTLTSTATLKIGGHIITGGSGPGISKGGGVSGVATVNGNGNDASGTVNITLGVGASASGTLASVEFSNAYSGTPRVLVTPFNGGLGNFYVTRNTTGFTVHTTSTLGAGSYGFDYFVVQ